MVLDQTAARKLLKEHGWTMARGGKHVVKMTKAGERPITLRQLLTGLSTHAGSERRTVLLFV